MMEINTLSIKPQKFVNELSKLTINSKNYFINGHEDSITFPTVVTVDDSRFIIELSDDDSGDEEEKLKQEIAEREMERLELRAKRIRDELDEERYANEQYEKQEKNRALNKDKDKDSDML